MTSLDGKRAVLHTFRSTKMYEFPSASLPACSHVASNTLLTLIHSFNSYNTYSYTIVRAVMHLIASVCGSFQPTLTKPSYFGIAYKTRFYILSSLSIENFRGLFHEYRLYFSLALQCFDFYSFQTEGPFVKQEKSVRATKTDPRVSILQYLHISVLF